MKTFFLVLARDDKYVREKIEELEALKTPYLVVCGGNLNHPNVIHCKPKGKYDAINFGFRRIPKDTDVVVLNDVDTRINRFEAAMERLNSQDVAFVFARVRVDKGPQRLFYALLDSVRRRFLITASGELMLIRYDLLKKMIPLKPCKAEDTYLLLKALEFGYRCILSQECYVETQRTKTTDEETAYKRRTVGGIYQALAYTDPPYAWKLFYALLPIASPLLLVLGKRGYSWMKGILFGFTDYLCGDRTGIWQSSYV